MQEPRAIYQYLAALVVNLLTVGFGVAEGWTSPSFILLTSNDTPLASEKITMEDASWIASLLSVGALVGTIFFGYITNNFGRKISLIVITVQCPISWLLIWFAQNIYYLYVSRLIGGFFAGSAYMIVPIFLSEISDDGVRGTIGSTLVLFETLGTLLAYVIGNYFDFYAIPKFSILLTIVCAIFLYFLPESPLFLLKQNKILETEKSIRFYKNMRGNDTDRELLDSEINKLKETLDDSQTESSNKSSLKWSDSATGNGRKAIIIGVVLVMLCVCNGVFAMSIYAANIFQETGSNLSPNMSAIVLGVIQLIASCITTHLVDRTGRKLLLAVSGIGTALGLIVLGVYMMLKSWNFEVDTFNWIPLISFSWTMFISSIGITSITFTVISEIMPEKIKDAGVSFCMILLFLFAFLNLKYLPLLTEKLTFHGSMYLFAGVCTGLTLFVVAFMPETKDSVEKKPLLFATIPFIINWLLIWFAQNVYYLCAARFSGGFFGAGGYVIAVLLLNEISNDNVRGALVSSVNLSETFGFLLSYIIGDFGGFYGIPQFTIALTVLFGIFLCLLPESPHFLMKTNQISEVEKSLRFYKSIRKTENDRLDFEVNRLKRSIDDISIRNETKTRNVNRDSFGTHCGSFAMSNYSANIFEETGSILSPNMSTIVIGVIQLCSSCIVVKFVDQLGRCCDPSLWLTSSIDPSF